MNMISRKEAVRRFAFLAETADVRPVTDRDLSNAYRAMTRWINAYDRAFPNAPVICRRTSGRIVAIDLESLAQALRRVTLARASAHGQHTSRGARRVTTPEGIVTLRRATI